MSAAMLLQAWGDTLLTTGLLVAAILLIRKPFARAFGPGLTYALWAIPSLRFLLPPLPFAAPTTAVAPQGIPADVVLVEVAATRSEARRVGKGCGSTCRTRGSRY